MSKIIKNTGYRELSHIVESENKYYFVDSNDTFDRGYETMIFKCDENGDNIDWTDIFCKNYDTYVEMELSHNNIIKNLEFYKKDFYNIKFIYDKNKNYPL